jgi:hypothetical protein
VTAVNVILRPDRAIIVTDGMMTARAASGKTAFIPVVKCLPVPHQPAAVAVRGQANHLTLFHAAVPILGADFDELKSNAIEGLRSVWTLMCKKFAGEMDPATVDAAEIYIAGISKERARPEAFAIMLHDRWDDVKPWTMVPIEDVSMSPLPEASMLDYFGESCRRGLDSEIPALAVEMMEMQRSAYITRSWWGGNPVQGSAEIGMFAQMTSVYADRIVTEIIHRWPVE